MFILHTVSPLYCAQMGSNQKNSSNENIFFSTALTICLLYYVFFSISLSNLSFNRHSKI